MGDKGIFVWTNRWFGECKIARSFKPLVILESHRFLVPGHCIKDGIYKVCVDNVKTFGRMELRTMKEQIIEIRTLYSRWTGYVI